MAKREDDEAPAIDATRLLIAGPKAENDSPIIDLEPLGADAGDKAAEAQPSEADAPQNSGRKLPSYAPLAAGIALAVAVGALAGAGATASLMRDDPSPASLSAAHDNRVLRDSVAQLGSELATLKAGIATAQRNASTQFGKLAERLDRAEKAQAEPAAKLAKIQESLDRLDHRQQQAAAAPAPAPVAAPEVTGSIAAKEETRSRRSPKAGGCATSMPAAPWCRAATARCSRSARARTCRGSAGSSRSSARTARWW